MREQVLAELGERDERRWLSVADAAAYLGCSEERVRKLIARGALPFYSEGAGCRISLKRSELDAAMAALRQPAREVMR